MYLLGTFIVRGCTVNTTGVSLPCGMAPSKSRGSDFALFLLSLSFSLSLSTRSSLVTYDYVSDSLIPSYKHMRCMRPARNVHGLFKYMDVADWRYNKKKMIPCHKINRQKLISFKINYTINHSLTRSLFIIINF